MATRMSKIQVGGTITALATSVVALFLGVTQVQEVQYVNLPPAISGSGANTSSQVDYEKYMPRTDLTATGGLAKYTIFSWDNPESYTGAVLAFCLEVVTAPTDGTTNVDCGIVNESADTSTGTNLFDNESLTVGLHCVEPASTEVTIGPTEQVRCASITGTGTNLDADAYLKYRETVLN